LTVLAEKWAVTTTKILCFPRFRTLGTIQPKALHGEPMKKVATSVLAASLGLMLSWPTASYAGSHSKNTQTQQQKEAQKTWKKYSKSQSKQEKKQLKAQKKQLKQWKRTHNSTTTVT